MATRGDNPHGFNVEFNFYGASMPMWEGKVNSSTAIAIGDALENSSGYLQVAQAGNAVVGIAQSTVASESAINDVKFVPALEGLVLSAQCSGTPTQAMIWGSDPLEGTTGIQEINEDANGSEFVLVGFKFAADVGVANAEVFVTVARSGWSSRVAS